MKAGIWGTESEDDEKVSPVVLLGRAVKIKKQEGWSSWELDKPSNTNSVTPRMICLIPLTFCKGLLFSHLNRREIEIS